MGRGDKRTKKGKITLGSFGKARPARVVKKTKVSKILMYSMKQFNFQVQIRVAHLGVK